MKTQPRPRTSYRYRCPHCGKVVTRECGDERPKQWRKSFCETTGKDSRLQLMPAIDEVTRTVRALKRAGRWLNSDVFACHVDGKPCRGWLNSREQPQIITQA